MSTSAVSRAGKSRAIAITRTADPSPRPRSGRGAGGEGRRIERLHDRLEDTPRIAQYIVIPKSKHEKSIPLQESIPGVVGGCLVLMLTAVDLNDEPLLDANEVDDERPDRMLTPEFMREESA